MGLCSIAAHLQEHNVKILDLCIRQKGIKRLLLKILREFCPGIIGLSSMSFQYESAKKIAGFIRQFNPGIKIVIGGYHATLTAEQIGNSEDRELFDFIVRGEGEFVFQALVQNLEQKHPSFDEISGLSYKEDSYFRHNSARMIASMDKIKLPNRDVRIFNDFPSGFGPSIEAIESSRGCVLNCSFCTIKEMYGKSFRVHRIERIIEDIKTIKERGRRYVYFVDDNITLDIARFKKLCNAIIDNGLNSLRYFVQASSNGIASSESLVKRMAEAGFDTVFLGLENMFSKNLTALNKGNTVMQTKQAVYYLRKYNILIWAGTISGLPEDDAAGIQKNFEEIKKLGIQFIYPSFITPYPMTTIRKDLIKEGLVVNKNDFSRYNGFICNVKTKHLSKKALEKAVIKEMIKFYLFDFKKSLNRMKEVWAKLPHLDEVFCKKDAQKWLFSIYKGYVLKMLISKDTNYINASPHRF